MQSILLQTCLLYFVTFLKECFGVLNSPYQTIRKISQEKPIFPIFAFLIMMWFYLAFGVVVKNGLHTGPLFLTFNLGKLFYAIVVTYIFVSSVIYWVGKSFGKTGSARAVFTTWIFSYLPTIIWFFMTTLLYFFFPPPRTLSPLGQIFSVLFLFSSIGLLFWKIIIYFLTLRFCLSLNIWQTIRATLVIVPILIGYFLLLNRMGIFKIPFA